LGGILALQVNAAPIYNLYNAHRAMRVDDILTVVIIESAKAGSQSGTNTQKQNDLSLNGGQRNRIIKILAFLRGIGFE